MNISLTPELENLVKEKVKSGKYLSASEVVREALRLLDQRDEEYEIWKTEVREKVEQGMAQLRRGEGIPASRAREELAKLKGSPESLALSYIIAPKALMDIAEISNYISDDNPAAAIALENRFFEAFDTLSSMPGMGHKRTDILPENVRVWTVGVYLIVYVDNSNPLEIARILHGKRDIRSLEWPHS